MPSLKDLRNRIASVKATQKITKAMQMVAAAKLRRAQTAAEAARPFAERMASVLGTIVVAVRQLAQAIAPVVPGSAARLLELIASGENGTPIAQPAPAFPRLELAEEGT